MNPEHDLLLAVARRDGDISAAIARVSNWDRAIDLLGLHGLLPMMPAGGLPPVVARRITVSQMQTHHRNDINATELVRFSDALEARGVRSVAYKGAIAARRFYGDIGLRAYSDFDVLVDAASLPDVDAVIHELEYMPMLYTTLENARNRRAGFEESWQAHSEAILDLHWKISDAFFPIGIPAEELLARSIVEELPAGAVRTMSDEDHLIVLATHAARHFFERLEWVKTIGMAMTRRDLDWSAVTERVARAQCSTAFVAACKIAATLLDYPLPAAVDAMPARGRDVDAIVAAHAHDLIVPRSETWRLFDRRRDAVRRAFKMIFEPRITDTRAIRLPHAMRSAYYVLRPIRLAAKHIRLRLKK